MKMTILASALSLAMAGSFAIAQTPTDTTTQTRRTQRDTTTQNRNQRTTTQDHNQTSTRDRTNRSTDSMGQNRNRTGDTMGQQDRHQGMSTGQHPPFSTLDTQSRGYVTRDNASSHPWLQQNFSRCDTNGDGQVSREEYTACTRSGSDGR